MNIKRALALTLGIAAGFGSVIPFAAQSSPLIAGEVVKVDKTAGKITIKHNEIKHLEMPAMTMKYDVRNPNEIQQLEPGDRLQFEVEKSDGRYVIDKLKPVR